MARSRMVILYSGRVQGVGFRYSVKVLTMGFDLTGTVRNLADGRVELIAEGERNELDEFRLAIQDSHVGRFVRDETVAWAHPANQFRGFEIIR